MNINAKPILIAVLMLVSIVARSQSNTNRHDTLNIYYQSLSYYFKYLKDKDFDFGNHIYLEADAKIETDSILTTIGNVKLTVLDDDGLKQILKTQKKVLLYTLWPLKVVSGDFIVPISPGGFSYDKQKKIHGVYGGSYEVVFKFTGNSFSFVKVNHYSL